ncbi:serine/threonine-protein kinase, putative [Entamoeba histolytica HM-1:IMSS-B]|nr:serine/threonine-protein kinase, putative [Entamoeba nuttalli P19]EMD42829.1 mitogenactivated protein kinase kinase, putative [Entamoeba histolytica KU27]EMH72228.1 serine/threonine-protein kinase, putative [Entamoeba histolytica HM-1:IMSS-B]EMS16873.1 mitogen-activated protein kinase kinase, putative [Entamoeba histolytica HM-3:IMSS]ENY59754.1 mitogen-activated protein kinase kinase, putative [Entamoeba histolytica HM-1:IMSS-A]GAT91682.1 serine threonine-protein kinase putative [Entamoeba |eukprot:XP_008860100.1 serine/threonine-protein kinase, putative [Entamoeba nuttalli P19]
MMKAPYAHNLDYDSRQLIEQLMLTPNDKRTPLNQIFFDVAVGFNKRTEYRMLWFRFDIRKLYFLRHGDPREELLFSSFSFVTLEDNNSKIKLIVTDFVENPKTYFIITQSQSDTLQIFQLLRGISTRPTMLFFEQDFYQDYVNKKRTVACKKRGQTAWARRDMIIFNGLFVLYGETGRIPLTMCPMCDKVNIMRHPRNVLEITTSIRRILLHFDSDIDMNDTYECLLTCDQYIRQPIMFPVKDFFTGKLGDLHQSCREVCIKNMLYPEECFDNFPVLCEILRAVTKKRCVTVGDRKTTKKEEEELTRRPPPPPQVPLQEDDLGQYCIKEDPKKYYSNFVSVGKGGFGEVFKATRKEDGAAVALKVLRHSVDERYAKIGCEVARMKLWDHPNLIKTIGCFLYDHKVYIGMEFCSGGTLKSMLKPRNQGLSFSEIAYILKQSLQGIAYIHQTGFIHRDIKTANILMDDHYCVKVIDFGLVVRKSSQPQNRAGSKSYMAPEVIKQIPYDEKVDIWSIGCVAQELLESQPPYKEHGVIKGMFKTAAFGAQYLRDETKAIEPFVDFVNKCFAYDPRDRPSCDELLTHKFLQYAQQSNYMRRCYEIP